MQLFITEHVPQLVQEYLMQLLIVLSHNKKHCWDDSYDKCDTVQNDGVKSE